ncbi:MAG: hypothetical protein IJC66_08995 [Kiritimatiellae bacterium]|nr:hypothetical protein [Kiritimatiellia bacterium]
MPERSLPCRSIGGTVQASGYQHNLRYTAIGAANRHLNWYRCAISDLRIRLK